MSLRTPALRHLGAGTLASLALAVLLVLAPRLFAAEPPPPKAEAEASLGVIWPNAAVKSIEGQMPQLDIVITTPETPTVSSCTLVPQAKDTDSNIMILGFTVEKLAVGSPQIWSAHFDEKSWPSANDGKGRSVLKNGAYDCEVTVKAGKDIQRRVIKFTVREGRTWPILLLVLGGIIALVVAAYKSGEPRGDAERYHFRLRSALKRTTNIDSRFKLAIEEKLALAEGSIVDRQYSKASQSLHEGESILTKWQYEPRNWIEILSPYSNQVELLKAQSVAHPLAGALQLKIENRLSNAYRAANSSEFSSNNKDIDALIQKYRDMRTSYEKFSQLISTRNNHKDYESLKNDVAKIKISYNDPKFMAIEAQIDELASALDRMNAALAAIPSSSHQSLPPKEAAKPGSSPLTTQVTKEKRKFIDILYSDIGPVAKAIASQGAVLAAIYLKFYEMNPIFGDMIDYAYLLFGPLFVTGVGGEAWILPSSFREALRSVGTAPGHTAEPSQPSTANPSSSPKTPS